MSPFLRIEKPKRRKKRPVINPIATIVTIEGIEARIEVVVEAVPKRAWKQIAEEVAAQHGVSMVEMNSARRARPLVLARQEAWWRMTKETTMSLPQIGRLFDRDHTTILHGIRKHEERFLRHAALQGVSQVIHANAGHSGPENVQASYGVATPAEPDHVRDRNTVRAHG